MKLIIALDGIIRMMIWCLRCFLNKGDCAELAYDEGYDFYRRVERRRAGARAATAGRTARARATGRSRLDRSAKKT